MTKRNQIKDPIEPVFVFSVNKEDDDRQEGPIFIDDEEEFDIYKNRLVEHPTSYTETLFNFVKSLIGTGMLAMANTFSHSGYVLGPLGVIVVILISVHCKHLLMEANVRLCKKRRITYLNFPDTIEAVFVDGPPPLQRFSTFAKLLVRTNIVLSQFGVGVIYTVFISTNIKAVCDNYIQEIDLRLYGLMMLVPLLAINCVRSLKFLAPFSAAALLMSLVSYAIIWSYAFRDLHPLSERAMVGQLSNLPLFLGSVLFIYEPVPTVILHYFVFVFLLVALNLLKVFFCCYRVTLTVQKKTQHTRQVHQYACVGRKVGHLVKDTLSTTDQDSNLDPLIISSPVGTAKKVTPLTVQPPKWLEFKY